MWNILDFWKVFKFLKSGDSSDLNDTVQAIAKSDLSKTNDLFINTLDQLSFSDDEFLRLRKFIIDWYSSLKTLTTVQKNISDVYGLPDTHLDELFRSKGFEFSPLLSVYGSRVNYNKGNFYYDLVNLYMKKGSPKTLLNVLKYFGFQNLEVLEYMTFRRMSTQRIEFHSLSASYIGKWYSTNTDILTYDEATGWDPHYLTSEKSIIYGQNNSKLHLPTKSPYFSLRHYININDYIKFIQFLARKIQDQYDYWRLDPYTNKPEKEIYLKSVTTDASVLEVYLSAVYLYYKYFGESIKIKHPSNNVYDTDILLGDHGKYFTCYDGTNADYLNIVDEFNKYLNNVPHTRQEIKDNQNYFYSQFNRLRLDNFLVDAHSAEEILKALNIDLYNELNKVYTIQDPIILIGNILSDLMKWVTSYISIGVPNISYLLFGKTELMNQLGELINFFKPYHARLLSYDVAYVIDDRNQESVIVEDFGIDSVEENIFDWDTCNSQPCCIDSTCNDNFHYSRDTYDCGSFYDIGGACDGRDDAFQLYIEDNIHEVLNCKQGFLPPEKYVETTTNNLPPEIICVQSGGFVEFDGGGCFDLQYSNDVCVIQIIDSTPDPWVDITSNLSVSTRGSWDGTQFNSEHTSSGNYIFLRTTTPISGTVTKLRATFVTFIPNVTWSWPDSSLVFDSITYPSNLYEWSTNWNKLGMRFSGGRFDPAFSISKIEAYIT